ncbi:MAG: glycosyltransferase [Lachnospiraceae bacterium]|jgi:hypothetical protein|nr:glycosyltransferase [Lachnospiraceae bacterium]
MFKESIKNHFPFLYRLYSPISDLKELHRINKQNAYWNSIPESEYRNILTQKYEKIFGYELDWNNLTTYTEKMQWDKLYNHDPRKSTLSDKYAVRKWVEKKIGIDHLIPLLAVYDQSKDIEWNDLPNQFVLKTNKGSGDVQIIKDKNSLSLFDRRRIEKNLLFSLKKNYAFHSGFELQYMHIPPKIVAEKYMGDNIQDYKFLCFGGKPYYCWVDSDRFISHKRDIFDLEWNKCDWVQCFPSSNKEIPKPKNFDQMIDIAASLSADFAHVRVDLYNIDGDIYFGEMTFSNGSGFEFIEPHSMNEYLGSLWTIGADT